MYKKLRFLTTMLLLAVCCGTWAEEVAFTFATSKNSSNTAYATNYDITVNGMAWSCPGNQNFSGYVRIGGKSISTDVDRDIYSKVAMSDAISKITFNHNGISNKNLKVNKITLTVASDASFNNVVDTKVITPTFSVGTEGSFDFTPTSNNWAANSFYKFTINVTNTSSTNYGLDVKSIVFYKENGGSSLEQSDLALMNAPVALNFDLYNSSAQTISYTTSSTGAVTVSGGDGYVTTSVNATNKTITVTPIAVTPNAQTITVSQAADDDYNAGTATFTVSVTNSATYTVTFDAGNGTFVPNNDFPTTSNSKTAGTYTLPSATAPSGYTFTGWTATGINTPVTGSYDINSDINFIADYTQGVTHTYNFAGANNFYTDADLTTHPSAGSDNKVNAIYYDDGSEFDAGGNGYFSAETGGYFLMGKAGAEISLPTFDGYKITQVKLHSSTTHSTKVAVSIVSGENTASAVQTWSTQDKDYTYNIASDYQTSALSVKVTNGYNTQFTSITLVCEPSSDITISADDVDILYNATSGSIAYTINNEPNPAGTLTAAIKGTSEIANLTLGTVANNAVPFTCDANSSAVAREATVTLIYTYGDDQTTTKDVTVTQAGDPNAPGTESNPYTVAQARAAIDAGTGMNGVYATGIVSEIVTAYNSQYGNISYNISTDGSTTADQLRAYRGKSYNGDNFTSADDIQVGDVVVVYGTLKKYNDIYEFDQDNQLVSLQRPASISLSETTIDATAEGAEGTINVTYKNITNVLADVKFYEANGETEAEYDWVAAEIVDNNNLYYLIEANEGAARNAYMKVYALDNDGKEVYSELVTITQAAASTATITLNAACTDGEMVYGTYSNTSAFVVSDDIVVAEVGIVDGKLYVEEYKTGDVVPANTGVMVSALEGGDYTVTLIDEEGTSVLGADNNLRPTGDGITAEAMAKKDPACKFYRLTMHNGTQIGFWWGAENGGAFKPGANKAYLAVPATQAKDGFAFGNDGDATEIVLNALKGEQNGEMYNLQGQKVDSEYKGIVIVNGKKVMVK